MTPTSGYFKEVSASRFFQVGSPRSYREVITELSNTNPDLTAIELFAVADKTGGGPKTTMPVQVWLDEISASGLTSIPTFHGERGEFSGYRSGEVHGQLRKELTKYFYAYRVREGQTYLFVAVKARVFLDLGEVSPTKWVMPKDTE